MSSLVTAISFARESNVWDKNEYTLDAQIEANAANAQRDGLQVSHTFREKFSGVNLWDMPELTRLRSLIQSTPGRKIVYVYAQDRLVRGEEGEDIFWLLVEFRRHQAEVRFHLNPVDLTSIAGKIQMLVAGNEASNEIAKILDRTWTRGRLRRMKEGKIPNSGPEKYGYRRIRETGKAEIVAEQAALIRRAAEMVDQGAGLQTVARRFNQKGIPSPTGNNWSPTVIHRWFTDPAYKGEGYAWRYSKKGTKIKKRNPEDWIKLAEDAYPAIIEPEVWDRIHARMQVNAGIWARQQKRLVLLRGLIVCDQCGFSAYHVRSNDRHGQLIYGYYVCGRWSQEYQRSAQRTCFARRRKTGELESEVWSQVADLLADPSRILKIVEQAQPVAERSYADEVQSLEKAAEAKLAEVRRLAGRLRTASDTVASHIEAEMVVTETERRAIETEIACLRRKLIEQEARISEMASLTDLAVRVADKLATAPLELQRQVLEILPFVYTLEGKIRVKS